jgi:excisionase family DNA binding protein
MMGLLTTEEAGRYLGKSPWWIRENIGILGIPAMKVGRQWRFRLEDLDSWLAISRDASNR